MKVADGGKKALILYLLIARALEFASLEITQVIRDNIDLFLVSHVRNACISLTCFFSLDRTPKTAAVQAVSNLIARGVETGEIKSNYKLLGHRQTWSTACPGNSLYTMIKSWPHWSESA